MKISFCITLNLFIVLLSTSAFAREGEKKGEEAQLEGYIADTPRLYVSKDEKSKRYSFKLSSSKDKKYGDEYLLVSFYEKKWNEKVGTFKWKSGDKVKLKGVLKPRKEGKAAGGLIGSFEVNNFSYKDVFKKLRKPSSFDIQYTDVSKE